MLVRRRIITPQGGAEYLVHHDVLPEHFLEDEKLVPPPREEPPPISPNGSPPGLTLGNGNPSGTDEEQSGERGIEPPSLGQRLMNALIPARKTLASYRRIGRSSLKFIIIKGWLKNER